MKDKSDKTCPMIHEDFLTMLINQAIVNYEYEIQLGYHGDEF